MDIISFRGEYDFLSNFYPRPLFLDGRIYPTAEHAFQAGKTLDPQWKERIIEAETPTEARRLGRLVPIRDGWEQIKDCHMFRVLTAKFEVLYLAKLLVGTGDAYLREGNTWGDRYWGCMLVRGVWEGQNRLGHILMFVRSIVRNKSFAF